MPRIARKYYETNFFHIIVQGINKEYIFNKDEYKKRYFQLLLKNKELYNIKLIAYCIMNNHSHILIYSERTQQMSNYMKAVNTSYATYYNKLESRVGFVFRNRYESEGIFIENYLLNCISYIHNNPVQANIVDNPKEYKYSSYNDYINKQGIVTDEILKLIFGTSNEYIEEYIKIHNQNYNFKDYIKENEDYKQVLKNYEIKNKIKLIDIKKDKDKEKIINITQELIDKSGLSIHKISKILGISRYKILKLMKE